ncbi:MAG: TIGR03000 domain-containing protein [Gemmataceae bacterium]|nr:TIGR03000 domain-containing protein [Gemmataceae bacterium]
MSPARFAPVLAFAAAALWLCAAPAQDQVQSAVKLTVPASPYMKYVINPSNDAVVTVNGTEVKGSGTTREFKTEPLKAGQEYTYKVTAVFCPNNYTILFRTRTVKFKAGDPVTLDLTKNDPKEPDLVEVRWVPTPQDLVDKMLDLAAVTKDDVVFEPGTGDARMVISAAKKGAKRSVGIEFDPKKTAEAKENVKKAGVADRVEVRQGDALKVTDYGDATVILLYMGEQFNVALKPLFLAQCKPGTRIVSHRFLMGPDWKPDKTIPVTSKDEPGYETELHLWVIKEQKK